MKDSASLVSSWDGLPVRSAVLVSPGSRELLCVERRLSGGERLGGERLPGDD